MCGISGAVTKTAQAKRIALAISASLERRGYDNAGIALLLGGVFSTRKVVGATTELRPLAAEMPDAKVAIGHTRWATTGEVIQRNAHPFKVGAVVGAGNGDITNHAELRAGFRRTTVLTSEVDTEVGVALISEIFNDLEGVRDLETRLLLAVRSALLRLEGSFALVIGVDGFEGFIVLRHGVNTAFIGELPDNEGFALSSDEESLLEFTRQFHALADGDLAVVTLEGVRFLEGDNFVTRIASVSEHEPGAASKGAFDTFLEKEINEQPACLRRLASVGIPACPDFARVKNVVVLACGSARYAGIVGKFLLETAGLPTRVVVASEFTSWPQLGDTDTLVIAVSQSGTTADVLEAVEHARQLGFGPLVVVTNTPSSPLAQLADLVLPIQSGPEISVASTKAVTSMVAVFSLLVGCLRPHQPTGLREASSLIENILRSERLLDQVGSVTRYLAGAVSVPPFLVLGQGIGHVAAREIALKIKELTALPTESFPARELKHGPIAMVKVGTPAIFCAIGLREDTVAGQVQARGAFTIGILEQGSPLVERFDLVIEVPKAANASPMTQFIGNLVPGQLLGLELAKLLGKDVDRPANLAKSATTK